MLAVIQYAHISKIIKDNQQIIQSRDHQIRNHTNFSHLLNKFEARLINQEPGAAMTPGVVIPAAWWIFDDII